MARKKPKLKQTNLEDVDFLDRIVVGIGEVSIVTGVSSRQIRYWEQKGIITSIQDGDTRNRRYDYLSIKKILLIKELLDVGYTLEGAANKVSKRIRMLDRAFKRLKEKQKKAPE